MAQLRSDRKMPVSLHLPYFHSQTALQIVFFNVRSLNKHIELVRSDHILSTCHVNMYCETRVAPTDDIDMYIHRRSQGGVQGVQVHPPGRQEKNFSRQFLLK